MWKLIDPYRWLIAGLLIAGAVSAFAWYRYSLIQQGHAKAIAEVQAKAADQLKRAIEQSANLQEVKDEAIQNATIRAQKNAASASAAWSELGRLRKSTVQACPAIPAPPPLTEPLPSVPYSESVRLLLLEWQQKLKATPMTP